MADSKLTALTAETAPDGATDVLYLVNVGDATPDRKITVDNLLNARNNVAATTAPGATDDGVAGYVVGSMWVDVTNDKVYFCLDATTSAAIWQEVGAGSGGAGGGGTGVLVPVEKQTISAAAEVKFLNLTHTNSRYLLHFHGLQTAANADKTPILEVSTDNGATWKTTGYKTKTTISSSGSAGWGTSVQPTTNFRLSQATVTDFGAGFHMDGVIEFLGDFTATDRRKGVVGRTTSWSTGLSSLTDYIHGAYDANDAINAIRIRMDDDTTFNGVFILQRYDLVADADRGKQALFQDRKATTTDGGTSTSGSWQTHTINSERFNDITGASLATNLITLPAGTYDVHASAQFYRPLRAAIRLYDTTGAATLVVADNAYGSTTGNQLAHTIMHGRFTLSTSSALRIEYRVESGQATNGLGIANSFGEDEVYLSALFTKL